MPPDKDIFDDDDDDGVMARHRGKIIALGLALVAGGAFAAIKMASSKGSAPPKAPDFSMVRITPLPPPPPPPPPKQDPPPDQPKEKMIEQTPMNEPEKKPDEAPKPKDEPPAPMGTNVAGNGPPDAFGLSGGSGNGGGGGGGGGTGGKGGSRWGWYAGEVQSAISNALRSNGKTRTASLSVKARIWADSSGRITRAQISGSTGNRALDDALRDEVLTGLQLQNPPPQDMPMPITLRINARKPN